MSLSETRKLLQQSRKVVEEADENTSVTSILNMILNLVSSIDKRLQSVEKCVGKFDEIKNIITSLTSRVVSTEKDIKESQRKITEVESGIQGVGNLFDNLKTVCEKNRNAVAKTEDQYEVLNVKCNKNKSDIKKLSEKVDIVNNSHYGLGSQCDCQENIHHLRSSILDLQCRSMKNNLIFTGLHEVRDENTEELLTSLAYMRFVTRIQKNY